MILLLQSYHFQIFYGYYTSRSFPIQWLFEGESWSLFKGCLLYMYCIFVSFCVKRRIGLPVVTANGLVDIAIKLTWAMCHLYCYWYTRFCGDHFWSGACIGVITLWCAMESKSDLTCLIILQHSDAEVWFVIEQCHLKEAVNRIGIVACNECISNN